MKNVRVTALAILPLMGALASACSSASPQGATGRVEIVGTASSALDATDVFSFTVTATPDSGEPVTMDLVRTSNGPHGQWHGVFPTLLVGHYTFAGVAKNASGTALYDDDGPTSGNAAYDPGGDVTVGASEVVTLNLQEIAPAAKFTNQAPRITALYVSNTHPAPGSSDPVVASETVDIGISATDADGDALDFAWTQTSTFAGTTASPPGGDHCDVGAAPTECTYSPSWTTPTGEDGDYTLTGTVSDTKGGKAAISVVIHVAAASNTGAAVVSATVNTWPVIDSLGGVTSTNLAPLATGDTTSLSVHASDPDNDQLQMSWEVNDSNGCAGSFSVADGSAVDFGSATAGAQVGTTVFTRSDTNSLTTCNVRATVTDGHSGSNTADFTIQLGASPAVDHAPVFDSTFQGLTCTTAGDTFTVVSHDPDGVSGTNGGTPTVAWTIDDVAADTDDVTTTSTGGVTTSTLIVAAFDGSTAAHSVKATSSNNGRSTATTFSVDVEASCP